MTSFVIAQSQPSNLYELFENPDGSTTIKNKGIQGDEFIEFQNNKFRLDIGSYITIRANKVFELKGAGDLIIKDKELKGVSNALIKTDQNGKIVYADFRSIDGGTYEFEINGDTATFMVGTRGRVHFDREKNIIEGENFEGKAEFTFKKNKVIGSKLSIDFDSEGNIKSVKISENGQFFHEDKIFQSRKKFDIYFNNEDITGKENAIVMRGDEQKILMKGLIDMETVNGLTYKSLSQDAYTKFDEINNFFDIQEGNVELSNGLHTTFIDGGAARLKNENLGSQDSAESFSYKHFNKEGAEEIGIFDEEEGSFILSHYVEEERKVRSIPLSEFDALLKPTQELSEKITQLKAQLQSLEENGATIEEKNKIKGELHVAQNIQLVEQGHIDTAIEFTKEFLVDNYDSIKGTETEEYVRISLAEMQMKRALNFQEQIKGISQEELVTVDPQRFANFIAYRKELEDSMQMLKTIQAKAIQNNNQDIFESTTQVLAQGLLTKGDFEKAAAEYRQLAQKTDSTFVQSEANRMAGIAELKGGNIATALQHYAQALDLNPANSKAKEELQQLRINALININAGLGIERSSLYEKFKERAGILGLNVEGKVPLLTDPFNTLYRVFGNTAKIFFTEVQGSEVLVMALEGVQYELDSQQTGIMAYTSLAHAGYDLKKFTQAGPSKQILMLQHAMNIDINTAEKFALATQALQLRNADLALLLENGDYSEAYKLNKNVNPDFNFKTGIGYTDEGLLKEKWRDTILEEINLKNAVFYVLGPEALISIGGKSLTLGGWTTRGAESLLARSSSGTRVLSTLSKIGEIPGIQSTITQAGSKFAIVTGAMELFPDYAEVISLFSGKLGGKSSTIGKRALLTADDELIPLFKVKTADKVDDLVRGATKVGDNLYEEGGKRFAVGVGDEVIEQVGRSKVLREIPLDNLDDIISESVAVRQEKIASVIDVQLPQAEVKRIMRGEFTEYEIVRIEKAQQILKERSLVDAKLLDDTQNQVELLLAHYSGNNPEGINIFVKTRPLLRKGFSREGVELLMNEQNLILGPKISVFDSSVGKSQEIDTYYTITDPDLIFNNNGRATLKEVKQAVSEIGDDIEFLRNIQQRYGNELLEVWKTSVGKQKIVTEEFLKAIKIEPTIIRKALTKNERTLLKSAFRSGWSGDFTKKQLEELDKYGLKSRKLSGGHLEIYSSKNPTIRYVTSSTPSDERVGLNMITDVIKMIEEKILN